MPNITRNIVIIAQLLKEGWKLGGTKNQLVLKKDDKVIKFARDNESGLYLMSLKKVN